MAGGLLMKNPYQKVINWLNSDEGTRWSYERSHSGEGAGIRGVGIWNERLYTIKDDIAGCPDCYLELDHDRYPFDKRYFPAISNSCMSIDGPYATMAENWIYFAACLEDE
jgi:hypothetical protein